MLPQGYSISLEKPYVLFFLWVHILYVAIKKDQLFCLPFKSVDVTYLLTLGINLKIVNSTEKCYKKAQKVKN